MRLEQITRVVNAASLDCAARSECGRNEVRIAYVLKKEDLERALLILGKALEAYNARK